MADVDTRVLELARMSSAKAADVLGISRTTVWRRTGAAEPFLKDQDVEMIYDEVARERPTLAPQLLGYIEEAFPAAAKRITDVPAAQAFSRRTVDARKIWLVLPRLTTIFPEIWPEIAPLLARGDLKIDVFVSDEDSHDLFSFEAGRLLNERRIKGETSLAQIDVWQPMQVVGLLQRTVFVDPHSVKVTAFNWRGGVWEELDGEETTGLVGSFRTRALSPPKLGDEVVITHIGGTVAPTPHHVKINDARGKLSQAA
jgi:hypothetical protein